MMSKFSGHSAKGARAKMRVSARAETLRRKEVRRVKYAADLAGQIKAA